MPQENLETAISRSAALYHVSFLTSFGGKALRFSRGERKEEEEKEEEVEEKEEEEEEGDEVVVACERKRDVNSRDSPRVRRTRSFVPPLMFAN